MNNPLHNRTFIHVFDPSSQDSSAIIAIVVDALKQVKAENSSVETVVVRSDNAGCYHSAQTLMLMPTVSYATGITVRLWDFSEPQLGKGPYDRIAALVKWYVRVFVNENNSCTNSEEFVRCATSNDGIKGTFIRGIILPSLIETTKNSRHKLIFPFLFHVNSYTGLESISSWNWAKNRNETK